MPSIFRTPELALGIAVGGAAGAAFEPKLEVPKQSAWAANPKRLPDVGLIAALVAGGKVSKKDGINMAARLGFDQGPFESLTWLAQDRLNFPLMLRMWRLAAVNPAFDEAGLSALLDETLAHEQLDWKYQPYLRSLRTAELVGLGDIAAGVVRSALPAPSYVPVPAPTEGLSVKRFPQVDIDPEKLAAAIGFDKDMLQLMIARTGLSLAPGLAATALFRGAINDQDFLLAVAEGDLRTEWADTLKEAARQIPTVGEMMEHSLRGFESVANAQKNAKRHGTIEADSQLVYDNLGRAPAVHAITTGLARGASYPSDYSQIPEPYKSAIQRSNIRPEFADIVYHDRYSYPSAFVLRALAQAGELGDAAAVEQVLLEIGWKPSFAQHVAKAWTAGATTGDPHVTKAQNQLWTRAHSSYVGEMVDAAAATTAIEAAGVAAAGVPAVLNLWNHERALIRKQLTPAQVKKAYKDGLYTRQQALDALLARGYDQADAATLLDE